MIEILVYILLGLNIAILGWLLFLNAKYQKIMKKAEILFSSKVSGDLAKTIEEYLKNVKEVEDHCYAIDNDLKKVKKMASSGLHKIGFIRYNPFGDVGGNQSFSLCLLNEKENGFVISSIHSRGGTRVYSKEVLGGDSNFNLSEEEKKAIALAKK